MSKPRRPATVREPVQVYLAADDSALLAHLAIEAGLSKAEVLRRGVRSFAREQGLASPMRQFVADMAGDFGAAGAAADHDAILAAEHAPKATVSRSTPRRGKA